MRSGVWLIAFLVGLSVAASAIAQGNRGEEKGKATVKTAGYVIAIHGGAIGNVAKLSDAESAQARETLAKAIAIGQGVLAKDGTSLDAVEAVIRFLEDDPTFNAGRGAVFNAAGGHELDASIMDGRGQRCGAVAGVKTIKNPISLARLVMDRTRHVLLAGDGAEVFAKEMRVELVENCYFSTDARRREWEAVKARSVGEKAKDEGHKGTVGCVALDRAGNLAAGTSTGGLTNKMYARIGDSPIIGAGTFAKNGLCAVSCTGTGEEFIRRAVSHDISARMAYRGTSLLDAVEAVVFRELPAGIGGVIAVDASGNAVLRCNTEGMACAWANDAGQVEIKLVPNN